MFIIVSGGTVAYYLKMLSMTFFGRRTELSKKANKMPISMLLSMSVLAFSIIYIGFFPTTVLERFIIPVLGTYSFDIHSSEHILGTKFFTAHRSISWPQSSLQHHSLWRRLWWF
jgi:NADH:ubiquinone oxidoreductase subunit 5 (subunit L)/multisubunit Na+/H+ antiporter MnhA subunit